MLSLLRAWVLSLVREAMRHNSPSTRCQKKGYIHSSKLVTLTILQWSLKPNSGAHLHKAKWVHLLLTFFPAPLPSKQPNLVAEGNNIY